MFYDFTLPNLFNNGPPFQIDGNFGALSGMTQMLVQSRVIYLNDSFQVEVNILPALPRDWDSGSFKGICVKGSLELDLEWREGRLASLAVTNKNTAPVSVLLYETGIKHREFSLGIGEDKRFVLTAP